MSNNTLDPDDFWDYILAEEEYSFEQEQLEQKKHYFPQKTMTMTTMMIVMNMMTTTMMSVMNMMTTMITTNMTKMMKMTR